jgi:hypothetical protein
LGLTVHPEISTTSPHLFDTLKYTTVQAFVNIIQIDSTTAMEPVLLERSPPSDGEYLQGE